MPMPETTDWHLAQVNIARLAAPIDSPQLAEFVASRDTVNARAEAAPGFVWRLAEDESAADALRPFESDFLVNMSVWRSVDALRDFAYRNHEHVTALRRRADWFVKIDQPHLALWWVPAGTRPSLTDAKRRLEHLAQYGATPYAFDFAGRFSAEQALAPRWHVEYLLRLADSALVLGQRVAEWCGHGPALEEDIAMANIGLDLIGQARLLLAHAGAIEGFSRDEDALAYWRDAAQYRNLSLTELPNGESAHDDYAVTIVRNLLFAALMAPWWHALANSTDRQLAAIAAKAVNEARAHLRHASEWTIRFGDGTEASHARAQAALARLWPYTREFFADDAADQAAAAAGVGVLPSGLRQAWAATVDAVLAEAGLQRPADSTFCSTGKIGRHSEYLDYLLTEMQSVARAHPGAQW